MIDPAAAEEAMFASDLVCRHDGDTSLALGVWLTDGEVVELAGWDGGPMPDPWRHATDITAQSVTPVDAEPDRDS